ncbi:hypothetical protein M433DRAFT_81277 [Acidomyces richmondensis BFW]|nr:hypothetical protein M433DRAFT_81277 [Acidomyces richmondensis BFW]
MENIYFGLIYTGHVRPDSEYPLASALGAWAGLKIFLVVVLGKSEVYVMHKTGLKQVGGGGSNS